MSLKRTYEELKQEVAMNNSGWIQSLKRTYEELKRSWKTYLRSCGDGLKRTYEELKLSLIPPPIFLSQV